MYNHTNQNSSSLSNTQQIQKLLFQAYKFQNSQYYDDALENLQNATQQIIKIIESMQKNPQFYMKVMPIIKYQRQLVNQQQYKQFWAKNQKVLCRNFEKNAYRALIMQQLKQIQERQLQKLNQRGLIINDQNHLITQNTVKSKRKKSQKSKKKKKESNNQQENQEVNKIEKQKDENQMQAQIQEDSEELLKANQIENQQIFKYDKLKQYEEDNFQQFS